MKGPNELPQHARPGLLHEPGFPPLARVKGFDTVGGQHERLSDARVERGQGRVALGLRNSKRLRVQSHAVQPLRMREHRRVAPLPHVLQDGADRGLDRRVGRASALPQLSQEAGAFLGRCRHHPHAVLPRRAGP